MRLAVHLGLVATLAGVSLMAQTQPAAEPEPEEKSSAAAEPAQPETGERERSATPPGSELIPLPLVDPHSLPPRRQIQPGALTTRAKFDYTLKKLTSLGTLANRSLLAGYNHWLDHPEEWGGLEGYGKRLAHKYGRSAIRNMVLFSLDSTLHTDSRYDRCGCAGLWPRSGHAIKRVFTTRSDYGGVTFAVPRLAAAYVTPMVTDQWYPDRLNTWNHKLQSGSLYLAGHAGTNLLREFWPDIRRILHLKRRAK
ncbi:MAG: hypothetical protein HYZ57_01720 [Acidobacteria bacterium]|nr:hypothetical protein [Acidobacteriota bacterium]